MPAGHRTSLPYLALALSILTISFASILVRWAGAPGPVTGLYRMALATLFLAPFLAARRERPQPAARRLWVYPLVGGVCMGLDLALWNSSLAYTSVAHSTLLGNTSPLWVALIAWGLLGERLRGRFWLGLALTMGGAAVVMGGDFILHPQLGLGDGLAAASAVFYSGYYLATQFGRRHMDTLTYMVGLDLAAALTLLVVSLALGSPLTGYPLRSYLAFLALALVIQVVGHQAIGYALGHLPASIVSTTLLLQPVVSALLAIPIFGEQLQLFTILGGLLVLAGVYLVNRSRSPSAPEPSPQPLPIGE